MKTSPVVGEPIANKQGLAAYSKELIGQVKRDQDDSAEWIARKINSYKRRYNFPKEQIDFPWKNSCNLRIPLFDIHIAELKAPLGNLTFGGPRVYNMLPMDEASMPHAANASVAMDSMLKHRMPDYVPQMFFGIDSLGQHGVKIDKVWHHYETRQTIETLRYGSLPASLANIAVVKDINPQQQQLAAQMGVAMMTREQFDKNGDAIKAEIVRLYGLDPQEKIDALALRDIMLFLRNGSRESALTIKHRSVVMNTPRLTNVPIEDIIVPQGTRTIEDAERVAHRMFFYESELAQRARDNIWNSDAVDMLLDGYRDRDVSDNRASGSIGDLLWQAKQDRMSLVAGNSGLHEVWEVCALWDIDGDGLDERVVVTLDPRGGGVFKAIPLPFNHGEWPYTSTFLEATDQSIFASRGIPEQIDDLEAHATGMLRAEYNNLLIETSRSFIYSDSSGINPLAVQWMPGLMIPVRTPNDLQPIEMAPRALALEGPFRNLLGLAERRVSGANRTVLDNPPPERRTATEVSSFEAARQRVLGVTGQLYQHGQKRNGFLLWELWRQYGPDEWYSMVAGEAPVKLTQAQIRGRFDVVPVGAAGDMDPDYRRNKAMQRLDITMKMGAALADDPRYAVDVAQAFTDWLYEDDAAAAKRLLRRRSPEEVQQLVMAAQQEAQKLSSYSDLAQQAIQGVPMDLKAVAELIRFLQSQMPQKGLQTIISQAKMARDGAQRGASLMGMNGAS